MHNDEANNDSEIPTLRGDETRLKQVLLNLVKNSFKFTDNGGVDVSLSYDHDRSMLIGQVRDTGRGIHKNDIVKLFSRFGKLQRTADVNHEGIGLGLTIVKSIIQQHKGVIDVESDGIGKGSVFHFEMKMAKAALQPKVEHVADEVVAPKNIKLVEDLDSHGSEANEDDEYNEEPVLDTEREKLF